MDPNEFESPLLDVVAYTVKSVVLEFPDTNPVKFLKELGDFRETIRQDALKAVARVTEEKAADIARLESRIVELERERDEAEAERARLAAERAIVRQGLPSSRVEQHIAIHQANRADLAAVLDARIDRLSNQTVSSAATVISAVGTSERTVSNALTAQTEKLGAVVNNTQSQLVTAVGTSERAILDALMAQTEKLEAVVNDVRGQLVSAVGTSERTIQAIVNTAVQGPPREDSEGREATRQMLEQALTTIIVPRLEEGFQAQIRAIEAQTNEWLVGNGDGDGGEQKLDQPTSTAQVARAVNALIFRTLRDKEMRRLMDEAASAQQAQSTLDQQAAAQQAQSASAQQAAGQPSDGAARSKDKGKDPARLSDLTDDEDPFSPPRSSRRLPSPDLALSPDPAPSPDSDESSWRGFEDHMTGDIQDVVMQDSAYSPTLPPVVREAAHPPRSTKRGPVVVGNIQLVARSYTLGRE